MSQENVKQILGLVSRVGDEFRLGRCSFSERDLLGSSCFTTVIACRSKFYADPAIKILNPVAMMKPEIAGRYMRLWRSLADPQLAIQMKNAKLTALVTLPIEMVHDKGRSNLQYLILPRAAGFSLESVSSRGINIPPASMPNLALNIARLVEFFHEQKIVHESLTPSNIFVDPRQDLKVTVLEPGIPRILGYDAGLFSQGEWERYAPYLSPEAQRRIDYDGGAADVFSFGCLLYWIITQKHPPILTTLQDQNVRALAEFSQSLDVWTGRVDTRLLEITRQAFSTRPAERPTLSDIISQLQGASGVIKDATKRTPANAVDTTAVDKLAVVANDTVRMPTENILAHNLASAVLALFVLGETEKARAYLREYLSASGQTANDLLNHPSLSELRNDGEFVTLVRGL